jgi:peroxiredoxin
VFVAVALALGAVAVAVLAVLVFHLTAQQGRLLLRLDAVEQRLRGDVSSDGAAGFDREPQSLPRGTRFPSFRLPDASGRMVGLEDFAGRRVLVVNWSAGCGFCAMTAPELARLQEDLERQDTQLLLIAGGGVEANRAMLDEHGLTCPVLLYDDIDDSPFRRHVGTPAAYLLDDEGCVTAPLALGAEEVPALARDAASPRKRPLRKRSLSDSRIMRDGLPAGTPAPEFTLPSVAGESVSLSDFHGAPVLLVFSDPDCGPCDELAPQLARLDGEANGARRSLALLMVGRGDVEANRAKAAQHGIRFPVVVQQGWRLSKRYGIFATPVAFLIDAHGVVAADVAVGVDAILSLARSAIGKEVTDSQLAPAQRGTR